MKRAILLTGFNNWGKTTHIEKLFKDRHRFYLGKTYSISGINATFTVESRSNDDFGEKGFVHAVKRKLAHALSSSQDLFCAFCPTRDLGNIKHQNDSKRILSSEPFNRFDEIHILLLKYKWDFHAELRVQEVKDYLSSVPSVRFTVIDADLGKTTDADRLLVRHNQIISCLQGIYAAPIVNGQ